MANTGTITISLTLAQGEDPCCVCAGAVPGDRSLSLSLCQEHLEKARVVFGPDLVVRINTYARRA